MIHLCIMSYKAIPRRESQHIWRYVYTYVIHMMWYICDRYSVMYMCIQSCKVIYVILICTCVCDCSHVKSYMWYDFTRLYTHVHHTISVTSISHHMHHICIDIFVYVLWHSRWYGTLYVGSMYIECHSTYTNMSIYVWYIWCDI